MIYFFHHYELPAILNQAQFEHLLIRSAQQPAAVIADPHALRAFPQAR